MGSRSGILRSLTVLNQHFQGLQMVFSSNPLRKPSPDPQICALLSRNNYFDRLHADGLKRYLVKRLESLGLSVTLQTRTA
jgi:hypothetical protein